MKDLILIGGGSFGREVAAFLPGCIGYNVTWRFKGFIDNLPDRTGIEDRTIGLVQQYEPKDNDVFLCTLPEQEYRKKYSDLIISRGGTFISIIHGTAVIVADASIGTGVYVGPFNTVSCGVKIGDFCLLNCYIVVGHDAVIAPYAHINSFVHISGFVEIGNAVTIHPHASILPGKKVGDEAVIGVGSIVLRNVKDKQTVFGYPARKI
ncbi:acetyltransferase [Neolewinella antarctica]|uniref:Sugar O-acyltransferase (Sialic acid O-acetyltransferase NeuD family) n=1 Tax=Neolewinella antarctica TaxID=442734 RepID=A0ABX0XB21_9BACT|nr:acetyltransferase [Neolewinella antarctica]NJC26129.1 sugar O-acyltransferase (sialic acid O-acetyltransferase NeuD family) [Neolewinella antarctica]